MSINDEYAVLGFALKDTDKEHRERMLAELTADHFTFHETKNAFMIICEMVGNGHNPRYQEVANRLETGQEFMIQAWKAAGNSLDANINFKALHVEYQRKLYQQMANMIYEFTESGNFSVEGVEEILSSFTPYQPETDNKDYMVEASAAAEQAYDYIVNAMQNPGQITGVSMSYVLPSGSKVGFKNLEECTNGLEPGTLTIFAAESGHGKTALAMNLARIMSYHNNKRVYYLNTEMNIVQMVNRWISMATMIPYERLKTGDIKLSELERVKEWKDKFSQSPLLVSRIPTLSARLAKGLVKQAIRKYGSLDCVVVDYIGRMEHENTRNLQEYQILSALAKQLKECANEMQIPFVTLAQLNADGQLEGAKKIRNECDGLFFFKPKKIKTENDEGKTIEINSQNEYYLIKEKVRNGSTDGVIHCEFDKPFQFIREV